ncbi:2-oxo acid dehydrogenase subunit E2 [Candidatus Liberibacter africanus]|uniref:Dihydrolipoamide acetyltransferase component of pyruvate dehydrogenase complex n=1 Tax=Candidatus Liberibacter africanus PTSAPSY TaxID=1277257 RepID=A0A0G3I661_LIBAF|nr:2-oxo acid dehydrogenase subunit E2 [Candidatus Liberibacter africanus]AKK19928.1 pyruvate dehydrogenase complex dihydrolipoamide acetyltransferase [Candidatus Liberibacter africanus PTSAPSY]QTP63772.1 2-oxo acid dehydrogenase subunit E2 [Candidatus Liberibacter africanus]
MIHTITMPSLSPTMKTGSIKKWKIKKGDKIFPGDILCEIETDKAIMEFESVDEGAVHEIIALEGTENIPVNSPILSIVMDYAPPPTPAKDNPVEVEKGFSDIPLISLEKQKSHRKNSPISSPLARRLAKEHGIDLSSLSGSGPHGRIIKDDVKSFIAQKTNVNKFPSTQNFESINTSVDDDIIKIFAEGSYEVIPHDNMRKTIAYRLQQSKQTIPHFYVSIDCNIDNLLSLREQMNLIIQANTKDTPNKISVNDVIIKAFALAMTKVPEANVSWTTNALIQHKNIDISVAVSIPGGIVTPIVRQVDQKSISSISLEVKELIQRAKQRKLKPSEYQGGTTSISNMGMLGVNSFCAVINPPQSTILAIGAGEKKVVFKNGEIKVATIMNATLSADHRSIDGAIASKLLAKFKEYIENPVWMLM